MKCKTCKHFVSDDYKMPGSMTCECPKMKKGYCISLSELKPDEVLIENDEGWGWVVGPEFGCIHHEK
jgi:hypothetical protein